MHFLLALSLACLLTAPAPLTQSDPFSVGVFPLTQLGKLRIAIDKAEQQRLSVRSTQTNGLTLHEDVVGRHELTYRRVFNLQELPAGSYWLVISNGKQTIRRTLTIEHVEPIAVQPTHLISLPD